MNFPGVAGLPAHSQPSPDVGGAGVSIEDDPSGGVCDDCAPLLPVWAGGDTGPAVPV